MVRVIPERRFADLIQVATNAFVTSSYRRAQMSDIARSLGVAKGTLYGYVESKEALFDAAVRLADGHAEMPEPGSLPLPTPVAGSTVQYVRTLCWDEARDPKLIQALLRPKGTRAPAGEFEDVVRDLYRRVSRNRLALKLVERCAADHPELASAKLEESRSRQTALLATYLGERIADGTVRSIGNVALAAHFALETIASWATYTPADPAAAPIADHEAEDAVADFLTHAYLSAAAH